MFSAGTVPYQSNALGLRKTVPRVFRFWRIPFRLCFTSSHSHSAKYDAHKGRSATARAKAAKIQQMAKDGLKPSRIASALGFGVASVYWYRDAVK
tara:strand:- start:23 stop:307 length:285 start_codon:yes stop_codon:yes gene_type:complete